MKRKSLPLTTLLFQCDRPDKGMWFHNRDLTEEEASRLISRQETMGIHKASAEDLNHAPSLPHTYFLLCAYKGSRDVKNHKQHAAAGLNQTVQQPIKVFDRARRAYPLQSSIVST